MLHKSYFLLMLAVVSMTVAGVFADDLEDNWKDFLHYTAIGRYDLSQAFGQKIIDSGPDPVALLKLSQKTPNAYSTLERMQARSADLRDVSNEILKIIETGRYQLRIDPVVIMQEIARLSTTRRGEIAAQSRLKNAGEYAIPFMLTVLADRSREKEFANIANALPKVGRDAIRPLVAALQTADLKVKLEIIRALGTIGYGQPLAYLKYVAENDISDQVRSVALTAVKKIDPAVAKLPSTEIFFQLAEAYYYHTSSLVPTPGEFANIWFWDDQQQILVRKEVSQDHFNELMAMRSCEWALRADETTGKAIALWIAAFFKAEAAATAQPVYFARGHADAMTYATTAGPEYLHTALERALAEQNKDVALGVVEALAANAGEKSLLYRIGTEQPLVKALSFSDIAIRQSAAIAIAAAQPNTDFVGSSLIIENLAKAVRRFGVNDLGDELADMYAIRAVDVMHDLALSRNPVIDLYKAIGPLIDATKTNWGQLQTKAGNVLALLQTPNGQKAIAEMALNEENSLDVRKEGFSALAISAKRNANLLTPQQIDRIYVIVSSKLVDPELRTEAASAYGALNLSSKKVKDLILDQSDK